MTRQLFSTFVAVIFVVGSSACFADDPPLTKHDEYFGTYQFADGRVLSGGPLIEGDQHLVFIIVRNGPGQAPPENSLFEIASSPSTKALSPSGQRALLSMWKDINGAMRAGLSYSEMIETVVNPVREADWYMRTARVRSNFASGSRHR